jgi:hypothetical protein
MNSFLLLSLKVLNSVDRERYIENVIYIGYTQEGSKRVRITNSG